MSNVDALLAERGKTHGDYAVHARVTQTLKSIVDEFEDPMSNEQREALDMILHKIGRICAGNPNHIDHWDDIAGYATLVATSLRRAA